MFDCILFVVIIYQFSFAVQSQRNLILNCHPQHTGHIFSTSLSFPQGTRFADHYSILTLETIRFSQELL